MRQLEYRVEARGRQPEYKTFHDDLEARRYGAGNVRVYSISRTKGGTVVYRYVMTKKRASVISWAAA